MEQRNMQYDKRLLLIFTKNPQKGKVKTRLAESIGDARALAVYKELLAITKSVTDPLQVNRQVWYSQYVDKEDLWSEDGYEKRVQEGANLGMRMQNAFRQSFTEGSDRTVIIGSDCAELTTDVLRRAYELLEEHEVVIGPSSDGGYYLLGMSEFYPQLFEQKEWSTASVCEKTLKQLNEENISYRLLTELNDIDTETDLQESHLSQ